MRARVLALMMAGILGSGVALFHGILTQRYMVTPLVRIAGETKTMRPAVVRLVPVLLHFSTFIWFLGGLSLIAAAVWFGRDARLVTCSLVGASYLFGVVGNYWATRGRHPGWMLLGASILLIALSASLPQQP